MSSLTEEIEKGSLSLFGFEFEGNDYYNTDDLNISPALYSPSTLKTAITAKIKQPTAGQALDDNGDSGFTLSSKTELDIRIYSGTTDITNNTTSFCNINSSYPKPYSIKISGDLSLSTEYGDPRTKDYTAATAETSLKQPSKQYSFSAVGACSAKPDMTFATGQYAGPPSMWDTTKGFKLQSLSDYGRNFPTTGANNLYFDLDFVGVDKALTWDPVTAEGITATMTSSSATKVRVTLTGPVATSTQKTSNTPGKVDKPGLPATIELIGKDGNKEVVKYGFVIKQWFINRGNVTATQAVTNTWCTSTGYLMPRFQDLTSAVATSAGGSGGASPSVPYPNINSGQPAEGNYWRHIGAGLFSEWGDTNKYSGGGWIAYAYWTSDYLGNLYFTASLYHGYGHAHTNIASASIYHGACRSH